MSQETRKLFVVRYTDEGDRGCPEFQWRTKALSHQHALEKFWEHDDGEGWKVLSVREAA